MSARSWSAPALWRFDCAREAHNPRNLVVRLTPLDAKAGEDSRSPRRFAYCRSDIEVR